MKTFKDLMNEKEKTFSKELRIPIKTHKYNKDFNHWYKASHWRALRRIVLKRDNYLCKLCAVNGPFRMRLATHVDHIIPFRSGRNLEEKRLLFGDTNNLRAICSSCHAKASAYESHKQRSFDL